MASSSYDILPEFNHLDSLKDQLLRNLHNFKDLRDTAAKATIFTQLNEFSESLSFLKSQIEFQLMTKITDTLKLDSGLAKDFVLRYGELEDFLYSFKKDIVSKQLEIKSSELSGFELQKRNKFHVGDDAPQSAEHADTVPELEKSRKDLEELENMSTDAKVMSATKKITSKLTQSSQILQASLMQSQLNLEDLEIQDNDLLRLADKYSFVGGLLEKSDEFVRDIKLSAERDRRIMKFALLFFVACVAWVWWSRILRYPVKLLHYSLTITFSIFRRVVGGSKDIDFVDEKFVNTMTSSVTFQATEESWDGDISQAFTTDIEDISTTVSELLATTVNDEFGEALGRIIDEL